MSTTSEGCVCFIVGPAGAGKDTVIEQLLKLKGTPFCRTPTATTRPKRRDDEPGKYRYVTEEEFIQLIHARELLEHATVHGYSYGKLYRPLMDAVVEGKHVLTDIDYQGAARARCALEQFGIQTRMAYLMITEVILRERVYRRASEKGDRVDDIDLVQRLQSLKKENAWAIEQRNRLGEEQFALIDATQDAPTVLAAVRAFLAC